MKKFLIGFVMLIIGFAAFASGSSEKGSQPAATAYSGPLVFWGGWTGPDGDVMRQLVARYNQDHPKVQVTLTTMQWTPLFTKFMVATRSGSVPDILAMHGPDVPQFASLNLLQSLASAIQRAGYAASDFATPAWDGTFYNGTQYAFPLDLHMNAIYYNAALFQKAGITPPTDWITGQQFLDMAMKLTVDGNGNHPNDPNFDPNTVSQYGIALYSLNWHGFLQWYELLSQQGQSFLNSSNSAIGYSQQAGERAWKWLQDLVFKYHVTPVGENNPLQDFLNGKTAMLEDGPWEIPAMTGQKGFQWGTFPVPQVFDKKATWGSGHVLTVPVQSDKSREVAGEDLAAWIVKNSGEWGNSGNIPALNAARSSAAFTSLPGRTGFVASVPYEVMLPRILKEAEVFSAASVSPIVVAGQEILVRDQPIAPAMQTMNSQINAILSR